MGKRWFKTGLDCPASTVGTSTTYEALNYHFTGKGRKHFYANGRFWVTATDGSYSIPWTADIVGAHNFYTETVV